jgi:hypothetical protein
MNVGTEQPSKATAIRPFHVDITSDGPSLAEALQPDDPNSDPAKLVGQVHSLDRPAPSSTDVAPLPGNWVLPTQVAIRWGRNNCHE